MRQLMLLLIKFYRLAISPFMAPHCRFYPSCSEYSYSAISRYGVLKGSHLSLSRLLKCHPWHPGGYDPLPNSCAKTLDPINKADACDHHHPTQLKSS